MTTVAVTGSSGFVGRAICARLAQSGFRVRAINRNGTSVPGASETVASGDLLNAPLGELVARCEGVVHCAARVHVLREDDARSEAAYGVMNRDLPVRLAEAARAAGSRRFVQLSSAAAVASSSQPGEEISDITVPRPSSPYGKSKLAADLALSSLNHGAFSIVSLRPPAIYGPGVGAWFRMFERAARYGLPLPLGAIRNCRSFVFVKNVADAVATALKGGPAGAFIVTDGPPVSSASLYSRLVRLHGHRERIFSLPQPLVYRAASVVLGERAQSLLGDAAFDGSAFMRAHSWSPAIDLDEGLARTLVSAGA